VAGSVGDGYFVSCGGVVVWGGGLWVSTGHKCCIGCQTPVFCGVFCVLCGGSRWGGGIMVVFFVWGFRVVFCGCMLGSGL